MQMASLYVGDLHPEISEAQLFEKFSRIGPVLSIRICRDAVTRRSLGYAYVNFQQSSDAQKAIDALNFEVINNRPIRIMWSQRDPSVRRSGLGNVFVKNLDKRIDIKALYDTFSLFGPILSCKIAVSEDGRSRGYAFIHFATEEAANTAIERVNGMLLDGKKVFVGKFQPRAAREKELGTTVRHFTNCFVKNFGDELDDDQLRDLFKKFGEITSAVVMRDNDGKSTGFGFVAFSTPEAAEAAVENMNNYELPISKNKLTVCRAQKKSERQTELKRRFEAQKAERLQHYQGINLYIKNLDESITDDDLRKHFSKFGNITSAKVMQDDDGRSKGFGFVCFEKPDDATKAIVEMNNRMIGNKPLYVTLAQRKEDRKAQLATQYMQRLASMRMQNNTTNVPGTMYGPTQNGFFVAAGMTPQRPFMQNNGVRSATPRWSGVPGAPYYNVPSGYVLQGGQYARPRAVRRPPFDQDMHQTMSMPNQRSVLRPQVVNHQNFYQNFAGSNRLEQSGNPSQIPIDQQKQIIGERLFPKVSELVDPENVAKITGMMLEMDNPELLHLLENDQLLAVKVKEANAVLNCVKTSPQAV